jgi:co-chaperonin GroES (HSP10)
MELNMNLSDFIPLEGVCFVKPLPIEESVNGIATLESGDSTIAEIMAITHPSTGRVDDIDVGDIVVVPQITGRKVIVGGEYCYTFWIKQLLAYQKK